MIKKIILAAADVAVVVDNAGVVLDIAFRSAELRDEIEESGQWLGQRWRSTVTVESRPKLDALLADAQTDRPIRWRHLNHPANEGIDVAISYSAVQLPDKDSVILLGRDLRATTALQQRLIETQLALERDYNSLQQAEARYRTLFETAQDGVVILDAHTLRAVELNPSARQMLGRDARRAGGRPFPDCFDADCRAAVSEAMVAARASSRGETVQARLGGVAIRIAITTLREEDGLFLLARLTPDGGPGYDAGAAETTSMPALLDRMPDAVAITDPDGDIVLVNRAFRSLTGLVVGEPVAGEALGRWIGQDGVDLGVLIANLRQRETVKLFASVARSEQGGTTEVEISATGRGEGQAGYVFYIRDIARRPAGERNGARTAARSPDKMSALIGRVPLKELVRESTDAIERMCIESALEMTGNNRASAAEMLGLSRQSLYVKLRRYGLGDSETDEDAGA